MWDKVFLGGVRRMQDIMISRYLICGAVGDLVPFVQFKKRES